MNFMILVSTIFTIAFGFYSINAIRFLWKYIKLVRSGIRTNGVVVAHDRSTTFMIIRALIPKVKFHTEQGDTVLGKPIHSWCIEFNDYEPDKQQLIFYDSKDPGSFIIKNNTEVIANVLIIPITVAVFIWFIANVT